MKSEGQISLLELLFSGQIITSVFVGLILFLGVIFLYLFFLKYFYLKSIYNKDGDFFDNIADCLYDHRIDSALDMCKRIASPESRIIKKGLDKIEKPPFDIFVAMSNQQEVEIMEIKKNLFRFSLWAKMIILLGVFGTSVSFISFFMMDELDFQSILFYNSFLPLCVGAFGGIGIYIQQIILLYKLSQIEMDLKIKTNKFIEIVGENK